MAESTEAKMTGSLRAVITRADGSVEDLGVISVFEVPAEEKDES